MQGKLTLGNPHFSLPGWVGVGVLYGNHIILGDLACVVPGRGDDGGLGGAVEEGHHHLPETVVGHLPHCLGQCGSSTRLQPLQVIQHLHMTCGSQGECGSRINRGRKLIF